MVQEIYDFENANGDKSLRVTENYPIVEHFWGQAGHEDAQGPLYIRVNANGERAGIALSFEESRRLVAGIESILAKVEAAKPKKPKNSEVIGKYLEGTVFELDGDTSDNKWMVTKAGAVWLNSRYNPGQIESLDFFDSSPKWTPRVTTL